MAAFNLKESLARKLRELAERQHRSPEEVLAELIEESYSVAAQSAEGANRENPLLKMAEQAEKLGLSSGRSDISERSREILNEEFPRYLKDRIDRDATDSG